MKLMRLLFAVVLLFTFNSVFAGDYLASVKDKDGNDLTVAPGQTVDAYLFIDYSKWEVDPEEDEFCELEIEGYSGLIQSMELKFQLPDGFELVSNPVYVEGTCNYPTTAKIDGSAGSYLITNENTDGVLLINKGALFKFQIKAPSTITASDDPYVGSINHFFITAGVWETLYTVKEGRDEPISFNIYVKDAEATSVDITLANEWNTYCYDKSLDFSGLTDVTAYEVTEVTATSAKLNKLEKVYAGQGFIIKGTKGAKITVPFADSCDPTGDNLLVGVTAPYALPAGNFILVDDKFVKSNGEGQLGANKAYLPASEVPSSAKSITFDFGETTGINEVQKAETEGAIYNLSGMRVSKTQKGVYIMNGRKVIVK